MPKILFINQHYYPAVVSAGQHLTDLAEFLASDGMEVHVLCGASGYAGEARGAPKHELHNGVKITRLRMPDLGRDSTFGRLVDYAAFFSQVVGHLLTGPHYDYIITLTTPPLLAVAPAIASKIRGQRYGVWSMDLHPDAEEALGMFAEGGVLAKALHGLSNFGYRNATFVVDLGKYMKRRLIVKGVVPQRLHTIPVWNKKGEVHPIPPNENPLKRELELEGKFVVMYSGNAGFAHSFDELMSVMMHLSGHPEIFFLFIGEGPQKKAINNFAEQFNISNFRYLSYYSRDRIKYSLSLADVHLMTLRSDMAGIAVPGKIYGIMASGRPILMVGPKASEPGQIITEGEIGYVIDPVHNGENTDRKLLFNLLSMYKNPEVGRKMGERGRYLFLNYYERDVACSMWSDLLSGSPSTRVTLASGSVPFFL